LVARRPAVGQGLVVLPSRSAAAAAPEQCQICDSGGAIHQSLGSALDQVRLGIPFSTFLGLSVFAGVHFTNSAESMYFSSHFWFVFNSRESKRLHFFLKGKGGIFSRK
jgi:hypothetical protein